VSKRSIFFLVPPSYLKNIDRNIRMRWAGHVARMVEERGVYRILVGKPEG
jgi:hypothetical protein